MLTKKQLDKKFDCVNAAVDELFASIEGDFVENRNGKHIPVSGYKELKTLYDEIMTCAIGVYKLYTKKIK